MKRWNQCDACGKFIALGDFESGLAIRELAEPGSHLSTERFTTLCPDHARTNRHKDMNK